ncbi:DUF2975 domain-containing protein [Pedobacter boryungensis]|uniref:DUF2975 domain-containing protein n=1 Tax=Pedobacter boryungensis TaxID=869962 RepID=A0ABX2DDU9_9SPHI|nr:DUF2975 domain-containing protein [Pedobacter boryungensis]NQX32267.1 DUF2975 domain-containing protein [Pedobacter boryungensis]
MTTQSTTILKVLNILSWITFVGLCVKAGMLLCYYIMAMYINPMGAKNLALNLDLSHLHAYDIIDYSILVGCMIAITVLEALLFYCLIQIFLKINMVSPFSETIGQLIKRMSIFSLFVGLLSEVAVGYAGKFIALKLNLPNLTEHIGLGDAFLFFAGILYFISLLFARGIELQQENELII